MTPTARIARSLRTSTLPYLAVIIVGITVSTYLQHLLQYVNYDIPVIKGQSPFIWGSGLTVALAVILWALAPWRPATARWLMAFLASLMTGWLVRIVLMAVHGDAFNYTTWLYPVIIAMVWLKCPTPAEARSAMLVLGWSGSLLLVWTRATEMLGIVPMPQVSPDLVAFEVEQYWLPLSGWLGPEGRWPGPIGGTAFTGMLGALLLVLAVALRARSSWVFGAIGIIAMLLTSSRGSFAAAAIGVGLAVVFSDSRIVSRIPFAGRVAVATTGALATMLLLLRASPNLTGRTTFWPDFIALWQSSPFTGVGAAGYAAGTEWTRTAGTAHSFFIDELSRNGLLGLAVLLATFICALGVAFIAARGREGGPLALVFTVIVLGIANTPFSWLASSMLWLFLLLPPFWAAPARRPQTHHLPG